MDLRVDKNSPVPSHYQLYSAIKAMITSGQIAPGDKLPLEQELVRQSGVSRLTVRQAVQLLCDEGLARKVRSRGAFVRKVRVGSPSGTINSFSGSLREQGFVPRAEILSLEAPAALEADTREHFAHVEAEDLRGQFIRLRRLVFANEKPILISDYWLNAALKIQLDAASLAQGSLYALLTERGVKVHEADQVIELGMASREEAALLGLSTKTTLLIANRADFSADGELVGLTRSTLHPTACKLRYAIVGAGLTRVDMTQASQQWAA